MTSVAIPATDELTERHPIDLPVGEDLTTLSVRELIGRLAVGEAVLRERADGATAGPIVREQARVVRELRRRRARGQHPSSRRAGPGV